MYYSNILGQQQWTFFGVPKGWHACVWRTIRTKASTACQCVCCTISARLKKAHIDEFVTKALRHATTRSSAGKVIFHFAYFFSASAIVNSICEQHAFKWNKVFRSGWADSTMLHGDCYNSGTFHRLHWMFLDDVSLLLLHPNVSSLSLFSTKRDISLTIAIITV